MLLLCAVLLVTGEIKFSENSISPEYVKHHHAAPLPEEWWSPRYNMDMNEGRARVRVGSHYWRMRDLMGQKI